MQNMDRFLYIPGVQASGNDQLADTVDHSRPRLHALPVESQSRPAALSGVGRVEQYARDYTRTKAVRLQEKVAVLGHMDLLDAFPFIRFVGFDQSSGYRVAARSSPATTLIGTERQRQNTSFRKLEPPHRSGDRKSKITEAGKFGIWRHH